MNIVRSSSQDTLSTSTNINDDASENESLDQSNS